MRLASAVAARVVVLVVAFVVVVLPSRALLAQGVSPGDAQADFAAGRHREALAKISRLLAAKDVAPPGSRQRYDLLILRGECMLNIKQPRLARDAFESAARTLTAAPENDEAIAVAHATALLIDKSQGLRYKPAAGGEDRGKEGIDIVTRESRREALQALYHDMRAAAQPQIEKAMKSSSLLPLEDLLPTLIDLYAVELAATDAKPGAEGDSQTLLETGKALADHARKLIDAELTRLSIRIGDLVMLANEPVPVPGVVRGDQFTRRGLASPEQKELKEAAEYLEKIARVCQDAHRMARRFGASGEPWDPLIARAADAEREALSAYQRK